MVLKLDAFSSQTTTRIFKLNIIIDWKTFFRHTASRRRTFRQRDDSASGLEISLQLKALFLKVPKSHFRKNEIS